MCNASEYANTVQPSDWLACIQHDTKMHCWPRVFIFCLSLFVRQGIMSLCVLFENLLQTHEPALFYHLKEVGAHP